MAEPQDIQIRALNLEGFERMVYTRDGSPEGYEEITRELLTVLTRIREGSGFFGVADEALPALYTRLAGAVTALFCDPRLTLTPDGFLNLASRHTTLHAIFRASSFETMDHVLSCIGTRDKDAPERLSFPGEQAITKMLVCWSLDSEVEIDWEAIAAFAPFHAAASMIGMLSIGGTHSEKSYARRLQLMRMRHLIERVPMHEAMLQCAGDAYMHCSYTDAKDKHELKAVVNDRTRELISRTLPIKECTRTLVRKERPTIMMPLEWFGSHHAMYRCYAPSILQLKERFRIIAVHRDSGQEIDEAGKAVFDKTISLPPDTTAIATILEAINAEEPDILYYPSLGMAAWYMALSNFRLAPIQVITPGHPATSMSRCIDYIVSDGDLFGDPGNYSERIIGMPTGAARYIARNAPLDYGSEHLSGGVFRIAVPAMATKIIPPFLRALQGIKRAARRPVEFHFFPNMVSVSHDIITKDLRKWIPDAVVHQRSGYQQYMARLAQCDLVCSTFPFGGTNSIIDTMLCRVPIITLEGDQILNRSDASMIRRMKMSAEKMVAHTPAEYVERALAFVNGEVEVEMPSAEAVHEEFFGPGPAHVRGAFLKAFEDIYELELQKGEANGRQEIAAAG